MPGAEQTAMHWPPRLDAIGGESVHHLEESNLYIRQGFQGRKVQLKVFGTVAEMSALVAPIQVTLMEVAELFAAKGGKTTKNAIGRVGEWSREESKPIPRRRFQ